MQLDLTSTEIEKNISKQLKRYKITCEYISNCFRYIYNGKAYIIQFTKTENESYILDKNMNTAFLFYTKTDIQQNNTIFSCSYEYFNDNKNIILDEICRCITINIIADIKVFNIRKKCVAKTNEHRYNLKNIKQYCRIKKLKIASSI